MPTLPAGAATVPVMPVAKIALPILRKLLVSRAGVVTALLVPIRMLLEPVVKTVLPTEGPRKRLELPVVRKAPAFAPKAVFVAAACCRFLRDKYPMAVLLEPVNMLADPGFVEAREP